MLPILEMVIDMKKLVLADAAYERIKIQEDCDFEIVVEKKAAAQLYIEIQNKVHVSIKITVSDTSKLSCLVWNESEQVEIKLHADVKQDATLRFALGELSGAQLKGDFHMNLVAQGASVEWRSGSAISNDQHYDIICEHQVPHTHSIMENYAVVYENGNYHMTDTGIIVKGAYGSESHQTSRALILSENMKCQIEPVLLIDENDVKASHAMTMGQIDENQLYYLQTRGLTEKAAFGLITIGYFMPLASFLDDSVLEAQLINKIEQKVGLTS